MRYGFSKAALLLAVAAPLALSAPAYAKSDKQDKQTAKQVREGQAALAQLSDPAMQQKLGDTMSMMFGIMMNMKIGGVINAMEDAVIDTDDGPNPRQRQRMDPNMTVGQMMAADGEDPRATIGRDVKQMTHAMGAMGQSMAEMLPVMVEMGKDLSAQWEPFAKDAGKKKR